MFLVAAASSISWSRFVYDHVADPRDGSLAVPAFATSGPPCVVHATQGIDPVARAINGGCSGKISGPFRSLSIDAVEVCAGVVLLNEWGGEDTRVHRVTRGDHVAWPHASLESAERRLDFQGLHFGELWQGGIQELLAANRSACPVPAIVAVFEGDGKLFPSAEGVRGTWWWPAGSISLRHHWAAVSVVGGLPPPPFLWTARNSAHRGGRLKEEAGLFQVWQNRRCPSEITLD